MARNYAALPHDYLEEMELLNDAEFGRICRALLRYSKDGEVPALSGSERVFFPRVRMQEDRFQASYADLSETRREAGKAGASKRWQSIASDGKAMASDGKNGNTETKTKTNPLPSNDGKRKQGRFVPPTRGELEQFIAENGLNVDAAAFLDYYTANGWRVGSNSMKDWKATARNWSRREAARPDGRKQAPVGTAGQSPLGTLEQEAVRRMLGEG